MINISNKKNRQYTVFLPDGLKAKINYNFTDSVEEKIKSMSEDVFNRIINCDAFNKEYKNLDFNTNQKEIKELQNKYKNNSVYEFCNKYWIWQNAFDPFRHNYEDKVKNLLDRLGTFLLLGHFKDGMIMTDGREKEVRDNEINISSLSTSAQDKFYGLTVDEAEYSQSITKITIDRNEVLCGSYNIEDDGDILRSKYNKKSKVKRKKHSKKYRQANQFKMSKIYSTDDVCKLELYKLKNSDVSPTPFNQTLKGKELVKWQQKSLKNVHGDNVYELRPKLYKGNKGYIDKSKPYTWHWAVVDTLNIFTFNGHQYKISENIPQYQPHKVKDRKGNIDLIYKMDKILVYEQEGNLFFFDQNIDKIENNLIKKLVTIKI